MKSQARIPTATYRLQFNADFTFRDAQQIIPYLADLGISDIYASPYFQAGPESSHGYDVADHNLLNPAVGDDSDFRAMALDLKRRGMGQILDFVPNHMGIGQHLNTWWMSVLENGQRSPYAKYFDIDWHPGRKELRDRILLPVLGDYYGKVLEKGEFQVRFEKGAFVLRYFETLLPISPHSYPLILSDALSQSDESTANEIGGIIDELSSSECNNAAKERLWNLAEGDVGIREGIQKSLTQLEGEPGKPESFDALHELLEEQVYRLSYWKVAAEEINYRRFFDINTLAAIRVEIPEVFEAAHQLVFELLARGDVTGLRIDHIDGLWDPKSYLDRLQEEYAKVSGPGKNDLYLVVEKILDLVGEQLPEDWPVHGTTGYEFANLATQVMVDPSAERKMTKTYMQFSGISQSMADLIYEKKKQTIQNALNSEVTALGRILDTLSEMHRKYRDFTRNTVTAAVRELIACFPVYRTYITKEEKLSTEDEEIVLKAVSLARRKNHSLEKSVLDFLRDILLLRLPDTLTPEQRDAHVDFVRKFQQCSGPVMAKGVEDTAFYIYNRFVALNELGGDPSLFGMKPGEFHRLVAKRSERFPHTLLASSTHDTKRSEDVRARLAALSEFPNEWRVAVRKWSKLNKKLRVKVGGDLAPSRNEEYLLYQTILGTWPLVPEDHTTYVTRIQEYMIKAIKEGKTNSSWTESNEEWENAVGDFVKRILDENGFSDFVKDFSGLAERVAVLGAMNSLTQTVLKCTIPGVPDVYQGTEIWDFSLVDPDNRRPVDFRLRSELLASLVGTTPCELMKDWKSGRIKLHVIQRLLRLRCEYPEFFLEADYRPLQTHGSFAGNILVFQRSWGGRNLLVVVPRLTSALGDFPCGDKWQDTSISGLEETPGSWNNAITGQQQTLQTGALVAELLAEFPVAVLISK